MVVAGISLEVDKLGSLKAIGVKDSKLLSPHVRTRLVYEIEEIATEVAYVIVHPREIDEIVMHGKKLYKLNYLEAKAMAEVIAKLRPDVAYVDASDVLEDRFERTIRGLVPFSVKIISEHYADKKYPIVSAASILAKVKRDELVEEIKVKYGDFGSGYSSDPKTRRFLIEWSRMHGAYPDFVRKSWKTIKNLNDAL
jgi:ribonuclease HII